MSDFKGSDEEAAQGDITDLSTAEMCTLLRDLQEQVQQLKQQILLQKDQQEEAMKVHRDDIRTLKKQTSQHNEALKHQHQAHKDDLRALKTKINVNVNRSEKEGHFHFSESSFPYDDKDSHNSQATITQDDDEEMQHQSYPTAAVKEDKFEDHALDSFNPHNREHLEKKGIKPDKSNTGTPGQEHTTTKHSDGLPSPLVGNEANKKNDARYSSPPGSGIDGKSVPFEEAGVHNEISINHPSLEAAIKKCLEEQLRESSIRPIIQEELKSLRDENVSGRGTDTGGTVTRRQRMPRIYSIFHIPNADTNTNDDEMRLEEDTFTLMMLNKPDLPEKTCYLSHTWLLGMVTFLVFQLALGISIIIDQTRISWDKCLSDRHRDGQCIPFDIPFRVGLEVNIAQFIAVVLVLATQRDILTSVQTVLLLRNADHIPWDRVIGEEGNRTRGVWLSRILFPNALKFIQGIVILFASFVIIIQSSRIIDLLKDFTALLIVSEADNIIFHIADLGYLGKHLASKTAEARSVRWTNLEKEESDVSSNVKRNNLQGIMSNLNYRVCVFFALCSMMIAGLSYCVIGQWNGRWMTTKYPDCIVPNPRLIGDVFCEDRHPFNSEECGYDGGDCTVVPVKGYPNCTAVRPDETGNGRCNPSPPYNTEDCGWDGGDCIPTAVENYPDCFLYPEYHHEIGDGRCTERPPYYTEECGYDGGDCPPPQAVEGYPGCMVPYPSEIVNDYCNDYPPYYTKECGYDGGECPPPQEVVGYPGCMVVYPGRIGNGWCNDYPPYNTEECGYDGGDCIPPP